MTTNHIVIDKIFISTIQIEIYDMHIKYMAHNMLYALVYCTYIHLNVIFLVLGLIPFVFDRCLQFRLTGLFSFLLLRRSIILNILFIIKISNICNI